MKPSNNNSNLKLAWDNFACAAEKFERQRIANETGMAFSFTEGALVDAIRTGKW